MYYLLESCFCACLIPNKTGQMERSSCQDLLNYGDDDIEKHNSKCFMHLEPTRKCMLKLGSRATQLNLMV